MAHAMLTKRTKKKTFPRHFSGHFDMQCTSCRLHSENLREYSRALDLGSNRKTIETIYLCAACRVINAINPKYVLKRVHRDHAPAAYPA
jgi:hypothetical protein